MARNDHGLMSEVADVVDSIEGQEKTLPAPTSYPFAATLAFRPSATPSESRRPTPLLPKKRAAPTPTAKPVSKAVPRARDSKGEAFSTVCFDWKYDVHAHHHRLICGHDVMTATVEVCGSNCAPRRNATSKVTNRAFVCLDVGCKAKVKALVPKRNATGRFVPTSGRVCTLSHVYGLDQAKDKARRAEKKADKGGEARQHKRPNATRKRSQSPEAEVVIEEVEPRKKRPIFAKSADAEAAVLLKGAGVLGLMRQMNAAHTRRLHGDRLETMPEEPSNGPTTRAAAKAKLPGIAGASSGGIPRGSLPAFKETRNILRENDAADTVQDGDYPEQPDDEDIYCVCQTTNPEYLVLCERCNRGFHPGCIGEGKWAMADYAEDMTDRDGSFKSDWVTIMQEGHDGVFHCPDCQFAVAAALEKFQGGAFKQRAAAAENEELVDDAIEALLPSNDDLIVKGIQDAARAGTKRKAEFIESDSEDQGPGQDIQLEDADALPSSARNSHPDRPRKRAKATGTAGDSTSGMDNARTDKARNSARQGSVRRSARQSSVRNSSRR